MQDIQNIPNPDVNSPETDEDFGRNPNSDSDIEQPDDSMPLPPDQIPPPSIDEPTETEPVPKIDEDQTDPPMIV